MLLRNNKNIILNKNNNKSNNKNIILNKKKSYVRLYIPYWKRPVNSYDYNKMKNKLYIYYKIHVMKWIFIVASNKMLNYFNKLFLIKIKQYLKYKSLYTIINILYKNKLMYFNALFYVLAIFIAKKKYINCYLFLCKLKIICYLWSNYYNKAFKY
jgi:hypothetical protein